MARPLLALPLSIAILLVQALVPTPSRAGVGGADIHTIAGSGEGVDAGDGDQATEAGIRLPRSVFPIGSTGYIFAEPYNHVVRRVGDDGIISTVAGTGVAGFSGDGRAAKGARLNFVHGASPTSDGGFLLADTLNNRIRRVSSNGIITTVAGTGTAGYGGDVGPATSAQINNPRGVTALPDGGFLIPDTNNHRVRRVSPSGMITTVAGDGIPGFTGDGGSATSAEISLPFGVVASPDGGIVIADKGNQRIRKVASDGTITTIAGTGLQGYDGDDVPGVSASLRDPHNLAFASDGRLLVADTRNERVRALDADGNITTVAGTGAAAFGGDGGAATSADLNAPKGVAAPSGGGLLIADESNNRIRFVGVEVLPANTATPAVVGTPRRRRPVTAFAGGWSGTGPVMAYQWRRCPKPTKSGTGPCGDIGGAAQKTYTPSADDIGFVLNVRVTATNAAGSSAATSPNSAAVRK